MITLPLVLVVWDDAWQDQENFTSAHGIALSHKPMAVETLGWLVRDDETGLSIVNECSTDDTGASVYRGRTFIPRPMVQSITHYKLAKKKKAAPTGEAASVVSGAAKTSDAVLPAADRDRDRPDKTPVIPSPSTSHTPA